MMNKKNEVGELLGSKVNDATIREEEDIRSKG